MSSSSDDVPLSSSSTSLKHLRQRFSVGLVKVFCMVKCRSVVPSTKGAPSGILGCFGYSWDVCSVAVLAQDPP